MNKCPICKSKIKLNQYFEEHILLEEYSKCEQCRIYSYEYVHGNTRIFYQEKEIRYWWNMSKTKANKVYMIEKRMIKKERKRWLKLHKNLVQVPVDDCIWCNGTGIDSDGHYKCPDCSGTGYTHCYDALSYLEELLNRSYKKAFYGK